MDRAFDLLILGLLGFLAVFAGGRVLILRLRGHQVVGGAAPARAHGLVNVFLPLTLAVWGYELLATSVPLSGHLCPEILRAPMVAEPTLRVLGAALCLAAVIIYVGSVLTLGKSWRLGADPVAGGGLVTDGIYAWSRHPIYLAFEMFALGIFLIHPTLLFLLGFLVFQWGLRSVRIREEAALLVEFGETYRRYCDEVSRYFGRRRER